jgi:hypothetical protein
MGHAKVSSLDNAHQLGLFNDDELQASAMNHATTREGMLVYHIDERDRLCEVSSTWAQFALDNDGAAVMPERVLGRSLWDFIEDAHIRELYRQMVNRARSGHTAQFEYRCDAPEWRRLYRMTIRAAAGGTVEFMTQLRWEESRQRVDLLDATMPRGENWVRVCSWCQNVALSEECWVPVEAAVQQLGLLAEEALPKLTHGICPTCHSRIMAQLEQAAGPPAQDQPAAPSPAAEIPPTAPL